MRRLGLEQLLNEVVGPGGTRGLDDVIPNGQAHREHDARSRR